MPAKTNRQEQKDAPVPYGKLDTRGKISADVGICAVSRDPLTGASVLVRLGKGYFVRVKPAYHRNITPKMKEGWLADAETQESSAGKKSAKLSKPQAPRDAGEAWVDPETLGKTATKPVLPE